MPELYQCASLIVNTIMKLKNRTRNKKWTKLSVGNIYFNHYGYGNEDTVEKTRAMG